MIVASEAEADQMFIISYKSFTSPSPSEAHDSGTRSRDLCTECASAPVLVVIVLSDSKGSVSCKLHSALKSQIGMQPFH